MDVNLFRFREAGDPGVQNFGGKQHRPEEETRKLKKGKKKRGGRREKRNLTATMTEAEKRGCWEGKRKLRPG